MPGMSLSEESVEIVRVRSGSTVFDEKAFQQLTAHSRWLPKNVGIIVSCNRSVGHSKKE